MKSPGPLLPARAREKQTNARRRGSIIDFDMVQLDRAAKEPLHQQLYRQIRAEIASGSFNHSSARLPSSRALAAKFGVARLTVKLAFEKLHSEGYLQTRKGSGTFVADRLPETFLNSKKQASQPKEERPPRLSDRLEQLGDQRTGSEFDVGIAGAPGVSFVPALAALDEFPVETWERLRSQVLARKGAHLLQYASSRGDADLRKAIAAYLCDFRGAQCHPDQVVITAGTQQAMTIAAMVLLNPGDIAWIEDPGFYQARRVFGFAGARVIPRPVDKHGLVVGRVSHKLLPKLIYVTPSHQFPLGMTMSLVRRRELIDFAHKHDAYIFEDDHNSEFRFTGPPLPCLQGMHHCGRVIYAGTMSKILFPSLRLGFLVAPERLVDSVIKARAVIDQHSSPIDQATLARFVSEGYFLSHIRRMRKLYADRREFFIEQFNKTLGRYFRLQIPEAGLHFVAWLRRKGELAAITEACREAGIRPSPLASCFIEPETNPALTFGFAAWSKAQIREGLNKLAAALERKVG